MLNINESVSNNSLTTAEVVRGKMGTIIEKKQHCI
jgi:hypothetical protein